RAITNIRGDLYRVQDANHYTVFLVTPAGIILGDPINTQAATWLKAELYTDVIPAEASYRDLVFVEATFRSAWRRRT
ncbi:MAG TPA: hypothetical protein VIX63_07785, partial [Vicinamibacterales bacterium]